MVTSSNFALSGFKYDTNVSENLLQKHNAAGFNLHTSTEVCVVGVTHINFEDASTLFFVVIDLNTSTPYTVFLLSLLLREFSYAHGI